MVWEKNFTHNMYNCYRNPRINNPYFGGGGRICYLRLCHGSSNFLLDGIRIFLPNTARRYRVAIAFTLFNTTFIFFWKVIYFQIYKIKRFLKGLHVYLQNIFYNERIFYFPQNFNSSLSSTYALNLNLTLTFNCFKFHNSATLRKKIFF